MGKYFVWDTETSIHKDNIHGSSPKLPMNDMYTQIYGDHPNKIKVTHSVVGFKRKLCKGAVTLLNEAKVMIGVNLKFDMGYVWTDPAFRKFLLRGGEVWCCQLVHYLLSGQLHTFPSLAELQKFWLGVKTKNDKISLIYKKGIGADQIIKNRHRLPRIWRAYKHYSVEDGRTPLLIYKKQLALVQERGMLPVVRMFNQYLLILTMMEHNGIPVNIEQAELTKRDFNIKILEFLGQASELVKDFWFDENLPVFNINSGQHSSAILFGGTIKTKIKELIGHTKGAKAKFKNVRVERPEYNKETGKVEVKTFLERQLIKEAIDPKPKYKLKEIEIPIKGFQLNPVFYSNETKKEGVYQVNAGVYATIKEHCKNPLVQQYIELLEQSKLYEKMVSTYLDAFIKRSVDGKISCDYNNCQTITSRLSSSRPNLQNIPSKNSDLKNQIQGLLYALEGWTAVSIDFSQLEVYCQAFLSQDKSLIRDLGNGIDFHIKRLAYAENMTYTDVNNLVKQGLKEWVSKRKAIKTVSFQKAYGASPEKIADETGLSVETVKLIFAEEDKEYCGVAEWEQNDVQKQIQESMTLSHRHMFSKNTLKPGKNGKRFYNDVEMLPIRQTDKKTYKYSQFELRHVGYYQSPTGKLYSFEEKGSMTKRGDVFRYFPPTQMKNYQIQGTASDCQAASSTELFMFLLQNEDTIKLVNEIHDSKWFLIKTEQLDCILPKLCAKIADIRSIFKQRFGIDTNLDFKVEAEIGQNFAEMTPYVQQ